MLFSILIRYLYCSGAINCLPFVNYYLSILRENHIFSLLRVGKFSIQLCEKLTDTFGFLE